MKKIIFFDDDIHPNGRISLRILPILDDLGLNDIYLHFKDYDSFKKYLSDSKNIDNLGVLVLDSTIETHEKTYTMEDTLPHIISVFQEHAIRSSNNRLSERKTLLGLIGKIMPASGNTGHTVQDYDQARRNNEYFRELVERSLSMTIDEEQMSVAEIGGGAGVPKLVVEQILLYYKKLYLDDELINEALKELKSDNSFNRETKDFSKIEENILSEEEERPFEALRERALGKENISLK